MRTHGIFSFVVVVVCSLDLVKDDVLICSTRGFLLPSHSLFFFSLGSFVITNNVFSLEGVVN